MSLLKQISAMRAALVEMKILPMSREDLVALATKTLADLDECVPLTDDGPLFDDIQARAEANWKSANDARGQPRGKPVSAPMAVFSALEVVQEQIFGKSPP